MCNVELLDTLIDTNKMLEIALMEINKMHTIINAICQKADVDNYRVANKSDILLMINHNDKVIDELLGEDGDAG